MTTLINARRRLLVTAATPDSERKRDEIQDKIDKAHEKIDQLNRSLPSELNRSKVSPANQITIRQQVLDEKKRIEDFKAQKLRLKGN